MVLVRADYTQYKKALMEIREFVRHDRRKAHGGRKAPETCQGALMSLRKIRFLCQECQNLQGVAECTAIQQNPKSYSADCVLDCGHSRVVTLAVKRQKIEQEESGAEGEYEISKTIEEVISE